MNAWSSLAHEIGWNSKGVPIDAPLRGVPVHVRSALEVLLGDADPGLGRSSPTSDAGPSRRRWSEATFARLGTLHPTRGETGRSVERWLLPYLEMHVDEVKHLDAAGPGQWLVDGSDVTLDLLDLEGQFFESRRAAPGTREAFAVGLMRTWSLAWLTWLARYLDAAAEDAGEEIGIVVRGEHPLPIIALLDTVDLLEATRRVYGLEGRLPAIWVHAPDLSAAGRAAVLAYAVKRAGADVATKSPQSVAPTIAHLATVRLGSAARPHVAIGGFADLTEAAEQGCEWTPEDVMADAAATAALAGRSVPQAYRIVDVASDVLDFFFQRFFSHPGLRPHQLEACVRLLRGESLLVLLPTGYGKSAIYQFAALMQPGVGLIVTPLRSLVLDQMRHLERAGITAAGFLMSGQGFGASEDALHRLRSGHLRLLYLTPERLEQTDFRRELASLLVRRRFSLIAVDEVHCASEWGHDFRPAYQLLRPLRKYMSENGVADVPMAGFTATASTIVRNDAMRMLGIPAGNVVESRSSDRPELSYSVHPVDGAFGSDARMQMLSDVLTRLPRQVLHMPNGLDGGGSDGKFLAGAIVFTPFASANQEAFYANKAPAVADHLATTTFPATHVGVHATARPSSCPECGSRRVRKLYSDFTCAACGWTGQRDGQMTSQSWDEQLLDAQDAFLGDRLPVLVSTKGFGMGIDKPNVRLIAHQVMSGSLEGYYQEAGRAGRDQQHAHVALVTVPPAAECASKYLDGGALFTLKPEDPIPLPCLSKNEKGFPSLKCPFKLKELCDVAQQAYLIDRNFPGAESAHNMLRKTFDRARGGEFTVPTRSSRNGFNEKDETSSALARLQTLTVVDKRSTKWAKDAVRFRASVPSSWSWADACDAVAVELAAMEAANGAERVASPTISDAQLVLNLRDRGGTQAEFVDLAGAILIDVIYTVVRTSRLIGLYNLHRYATLAKGECRRVYLRRAFDVQPLTEEYACGFCDNCVPDLAFERTRAYVPEERTRGQELGQRLSDLMVRFDLAGLIAFGRDAYPGFAAAVQVRAEQLLEQTPSDLSVLFLAASSAGAQGSAGLARNLALRADAVMVRRGTDLRERLEFLFALAEWQPDLPTHIVGDIEGPFQARGARTQLLAALTNHDDRLAMLLERRYGLEQVVDLARTASKVVPLREVAGFRAAAARAGATRSKGSR